MTVPINKSIAQEQDCEKRQIPLDPVAANVAGTLRAEGESAGPEYETRKQLADRICCSTRTIDNLQNAGLPYIKLSEKLVRFPRREVDAWLRQQMVTR